MLAIPIATCLACTVLAARAPVAGAAPRAASNYTPEIGLVPYAGNVYTYRRAAP